MIKERKFALPSINQELWGIRYPPSCITKADAFSHQLLFIWAFAKSSVSKQFKGSYCSRQLLVLIWFVEPVAHKDSKPCARFEEVGVAHSCSVPKLLSHCQPELKWMQFGQFFRTVSTWAHLSSSKFLHSVCLISSYSLVSLQLHKDEKLLLSFLHDWINTKHFSEQVHTKNSSGRCCIE